MPTASRPPHAVGIAAALHPLVLDPAGEGPVRSVVPPVVEAVRVPGPVEVRIVTPDVAVAAASQAPRSAPVVAVSAAARIAPEISADRARHAMQASRMVRIH